MSSTASTLTGDALVSRVHELPSPPAVIIDLIHSLNNDQCDLVQLAHKVETDQALVSKTLRIANSPFYGLRGQISNVREAITVLGFRSVRSMLLAGAISNTFKNTHASKFNLHNFWIHSLQTAFAARTLAQSARIPTEHAFIAGLLHDIGKLVIATIAPELAETILTYAEEKKCDWHEAERSLGLPTHLAVGAELARQWHFPNMLCTAIASHHAPIPIDQPIARVIHVANVLVHCVATATENEAEIPALDDDAWKHLSPTHEQLVQTVQSIRLGSSTAHQFF